MAERQGHSGELASGGMEAVHSAGGIQGRWRRMIGGFYECFHNSFYNWQKMQKVLAASEQIRPREYGEYLQKKRRKKKRRAKK